MIQAVLSLSTLTSLALASDFDLTWHTIDGGGAYSAGGSFELEGTIGQPDAGALAGGSFTLTGGFWTGASVSVDVPGDCNDDSSVDLQDFGGMPACMAGPGGGIGTGCDCVDLDADGDVDLSDVAEFQAQFTGDL
jgi:hypothetical protein